MDDENNNKTTSPSSNNAQSLALRFQKKVASKMSSKSVAKIFIDDTTGRILDNLSSLIKDFSGSKKQAEAILTDIIKIIVKIGILFKNNQLSADELNLCNAFRQKFHFFVKSALSFYEINFTFDVEHLVTLLKESQKLIQSIVEKHLTDKSKNRIDNVFNFCSDPDFIRDIYKNDKHKAAMSSIVDDARHLLDEGSI